MKRTELTEGAEVYWADTNTYEESAYGRQGKATVIMVAARNVAHRHEAPRYVPVNREDPGYAKARVLVILDKEAAWGSEPERVTVPLNQLRGPYAETAERVRANRERIAEAQRDREGRDAARRRRSVDLAARLRKLLGLAEPKTPTDTRSGIDDTGRYGDGRHVTLTLDAAQAIADRIVHLEAQVGELTNDLARERLAARRERSSEV